MIPKDTKKPVDPRKVRTQERGEPLDGTNEANTDKRIVSDAFQNVKYQSVYGKERGRDVLAVFQRIHIGIVCRQRRGAGAGYQTG